MGTVIRFPEERRAAWSAAAVLAQAGPGSVVILPVVRIERHGDEPSNTLTPGAGDSGSGGRRRRGRRS